MEEQMSMDFGDMEEGLKTSNLKADPVSGNDIPRGSNPEEVRDDVDAQLSDGEYVVPADVVRYFGVSYFEKLREKAKKGLDEMDKGGRINGEEPEEEASTQLMNEPMMAEGGSVQKDEKVDPYQVTPQSAYAPNTYGPSVLMNKPVKAGLEWRIVEGPGGRKMRVAYINGVPVGRIPRGFRDTGQVEDFNQTPAPNPYPASDRDGGDSALQDPNTSPTHPDNMEVTQKAGTSNVDNYVPDSENPMRSEEALNEWAESETSGMINTGSAIAGAAGMVMGGGLVGGAKAAQSGDAMYDKSVYNAAAQMAEAAGYEELAEEYQAKADAIDAGLVGEIAAPGTMRAAKYIESYGQEPGVQTYSQAVAGGGTEYSGPQTAAISEAEARAEQLASDHDGGDSSLGDAQTYESANTSGTVSNVGGSSVNDYGTSVASGSTAPETSSRPPSMARGGLVARKGKPKVTTNKKRTRKGLASK